MILRVGLYVMYFCRNLIFASNLGLVFSHFLPSSFHRKTGIAVKSVYGGGILSCFLIKSWRKKRLSKVSVIGFSISFSPSR